MPNFPKDAYGFEYTVTPNALIRLQPDNSLGRLGPIGAYGTIVAAQGAISDDVLELAVDWSTDLIDFDAASAMTDIEIGAPGNYLIEVQHTPTGESAGTAAPLEIAVDGTTVSQGQINTTSAGTIRLFAIVEADAETTMAAPLVVNFVVTQTENIVGRWLVWRLADITVEA